MRRTRRRSWAAEPWDYCEDGWEATWALPGELGCYDKRPAIPDALLADDDFRQCWHAAWSGTPELLPQAVLEAGMDVAMHGRRRCCWRGHASAAAVEYMISSGFPDTEENRTGDLSCLEDRVPYTVPSANHVQPIAAAGVAGVAIGATIGAVLAMLKETEAVTVFLENVYLYAIQ
jgi:hypothetical protein